MAYCSLDRSRGPLTGAEERSCWVRGSVEAARDPDPAPMAAPRMPSLWGLEAPRTDPADTSVRTSGLLPESGRHPAAIPPASPQPGSGVDRRKAWGRPPGLVNPPRGFRATPKPK
jgi:hypothetical protein